MTALALIGAFLFAYYGIGQVTIFFSRRLFGIPKNDDPVIQMVGLIWPATLPLLGFVWLIAVCRTIRYWPYAPGKGS